MSTASAIPVDSDFYDVHNCAGIILPGRLEQAFVERLAAATAATSRDYRGLMEKIQQQAKLRGYITSSDVGPYAFFRKLHTETIKKSLSPSERAVLYGDVIIAAVLDCPGSNFNIYT